MQEKLENNGIIRSNGTFRACSNQMQTVDLEFIWSGLIEDMHILLLLLFGRKMINIMRLAACPRIL